MKAAASDPALVDWIHPQVTTGRLHPRHPGPEEDLGARIVCSGLPLVWGYEVGCGLTSARATDRAWCDKCLRAMFPPLRLLVQDDF